MYKSIFVVVTCFIFLIPILGCDGITEKYVPNNLILGNSNEKDITYFSFKSSRNPTLAHDTEGIIEEYIEPDEIYGVITVDLTPYDVDITKLIADFKTTGWSITAEYTTYEDGWLVYRYSSQYSGISAIDFTDPVVYKVRAYNGTTKKYYVYVIY